ncbi:MAG: YihY/virulence factor BrkB family protein [Gemmatimonadaceae bacterium]
MTFLAGGVAFNVLLAGVPFILLLASGLGFLLGASEDASTAMVQHVLDRVLPRALEVEGSMLDPVMADVVRTRAAFGIGGAIGFLVFSARLFRSLRSVMTTAFEHRTDRSVLGGMLWDLQLSVLSAVLLAGWVVVSAWIAVSRGNLGAALTDYGLLANVMSGLEVVLFRLLAIAILIGVFVALYRWLPKARTPWVSAIAGGVVAGTLFEVARVLFSVVVRSFPPGSIYTGTLGALVIIVFWTYYAAMIFVVGAEFASAVESQLRPQPPWTRTHPPEASDASEAREASEASDGSD